MIPLKSTKFGSWKKHLCLQIYVSRRIFYGLEKQQKTIDLCFVKNVEFLLRHLVEIVDSSTKSSGTRAMKVRFSPQVISGRQRDW